MHLHSKLKETALRRVLLPLGDAWLGHPMTKRLGELEQAQWWPRERIDAERNRKLQQLAAVAYHEVPFYRELFDQAGVRPADIRTPADLSKLPVVTKAMLRQAYPERSCRRVPGRTYESSTSGSTGKNFRFREDHETAGWYRATFLLALEWAGWRLGEPHLQVGTTHRNLERRLKDTLLGCNYLSAYDLTPGALDRALELIERRHIRHLWGYPATLNCLAARAQQCGWNKKLTSIVTWGDQLLPDYRRTIEQAFGTMVYDTYGCSEGMQIAAQCGQGTHYHLHDLDVIAEFLDADGQPVGPSQPGNIVLTRLHPGPMPFLRYQVGDLGTAGAAGLCQCGRELRLLNSLEGRSGDYVLTVSGNQLVLHFFTSILRAFPQVDSFQVIQDRLDRVKLRIVPAVPIDAVTSQRIKTAFQRREATLAIDIELMDQIPLTPAGKRRLIIRNIARDNNQSSQAQGILEPLTGLPSPSNQLEALNGKATGR